jgi:hypothetical protein
MQGATAIGELVGRQHFDAASLEASRRTATCGAHTDAAEDELVTGGPRVAAGFERVAA